MRGRVKPGNGTTPSMLAAELNRYRTKTRWEVEREYALAVQSYGEDVWGPRAEPLYAILEYMGVSVSLVPLDTLRDVTLGLRHDVDFRPQAVVTEPEEDGD